MVTINQIAENIAYKLGEQFNDTLRESIKLDIRHWRSLLIRRDLERNPLSYNHFLQTICVELEEASASDCPYAPPSCSVLKSKQKIARPLRTKNNGRTNFHFVGDVLRQKAFQFATRHGLQYKFALPLQDNAVYYGFNGDYLLVYNLHLACKVALEYIVEDPTEIDSCDEPDVFPDDRAFPLSEDMVAEISDIIISKRREPLTDGKEVTTENDN